MLTEYKYSKLLNQLQIEVRAHRYLFIKFTLG
jgi:hypothetical protein